MFRIEKSKMETIVLISIGIFPNVYSSLWFICWQFAKLLHNVTIGSIKFIPWDEKFYIRQGYKNVNKIKKYKKNYSGIDLPFLNK